MEMCKLETDAHEIAGLRQDGFATISQAKHPTAVGHAPAGRRERYRLGAQKTAGRRKVASFARRARTRMLLGAGTRRVCLVLRGTSQMRGSSCAVQSCLAPLANNGPEKVPPLGSPRRARHAPPASTNQLLVYGPAPVCRYRLAPPARIWQATLL